MIGLKIIAVAILAASAGPALAAPAGPAAKPATAAPAPAPRPAPRLSNFADLVFAGIVGENAPEITADFAGGTTLGTTPLAFEKTRLADIQALYGGQLQTQGDAGNAASWLCYTRHARTRADTPTTVWLVSTSGPTAAGNPLDLLVVENVDAATASGCTNAPKGFVFPSFGVPGIGATLADLKAKFGTLARDRQGNVYYNSTRALGDGSGNSVYQTLGYVMSRKGVALGIAISQQTTH